MKATGIIVEYNPFHNGHLYHATEARKASDADVVIAVMSGNFLQRGEPAFVDKWTRTHMALQGGVDLVFELPYAFATAHAPTFAEGAIRLLDSVHCHSFCFGSEGGKITPFEKSVELIEQAGVTYEQTVKASIKEGVSYPKALNEAYLTAVRSAGAEKDVVDLTKPNNILGFQYMQAVSKIGSLMQAVTIPRIGANYFDDAKEGNPIASATGIRKAFFESLDLDRVDGFVSPSAKACLQKWQADYATFGSWQAFYPLLRFTILRAGPERLAEIADITEGIENLFFRAATNQDQFHLFMEEVKSKRYTWTRLQRMLTHIFTGFTYDMRQVMNAPSYLRLLGMTHTGQRYLNQNKKRLKLPLVSKAAAFSNDSLKMDIHAADMYALGIGHGTNNSPFGADYKTSPIMIP